MSATSTVVSVRRNRRDAPTISRTPPSPRLDAHVITRRRAPQSRQRAAVADLQTLLLDGEDGPAEPPTLLADGVGAAGRRDPDRQIPATHQAPLGQGEVLGATHFGFGL